ncbi:MAG: potassium transporter TrkH [Nitratireductor sp.]|nr:potassium transporter TrkH [Nitratireductor sp.]
MSVTGLLLSGLAMVMLVPAAVDVLAGDPNWQVFAASAVITGTIGSLLAIAMHRPNAMRMTVRQAFLTTAVVWIAMSASSALPFVGVGLDYDDAVFEAVSGLTTTGSTVITGLDGLAPGVLFWRSLLQWIGGVGIVVMAIIMLPFLRVGGMQLFRTESSDQSEKIVPRPLELVGHIAAIYVGFSIACMVGYALAGMSLFDALNHAMTTISTGGYSTRDVSFGYFTPAAQWLAVVFMLAGALPFVVYIKAIKGEPLALWRDVQVRAIIGFLTAVSFVTAIWLSLSQEIPFLEGLRLAAFNVVSITTTTGYASTNYVEWGAPAIGLFLLLTFIGGCTGSTAGGIKVYRFQVLGVIIRGHVQSLARPSRVVTLKYAGHRLPNDVPVSVLAFLAVYIGTVATVTLILTMMGLDLVTALSSAAQAVANVGPGLGEIVGPAGNFAELPDAAKWVLSVSMLMGRLELFTILLLFAPEFWRG